MTATGRDGGSHRRHGRGRRSASCALLLLAFAGSPALAADQTVLGTQLLVKNPGAPAKRTIVVVAKEKASPNTVVGAPTTGGATLTIALEGGSPGRETYQLPAGVSAATRKPFWSGDATTGFKYRDAKGENGPVKAVQLRRKKGVFQLTATVDGKLGPVSLTPPGPGTGACVALALGDGDSYSVRFAEKAKNKATKLFKVGKQTREGSCVDAARTTTTTTAPGATTTTTATAGSTTTTTTTLPDGEVFCASLTLLDEGTCAVTAGDDRLLLEGDVLAPDTVYRGGQVLIDATGVMTCVGCDCAASGATRVTCPAGVISPGLINGADHLTFTHNVPATDTGERYEHRHNWLTGSGSHNPISSVGAASTDQIRWGELRFLMGGATSTVAAGGAAGLIRNLDSSSNSGLAAKSVRVQTFPLGDSNGTMRTSGCAYPDIMSPAQIADDPGFFGVAAEGINAAARNELACLTSSADGGEDLGLPQTTFTKSVGVPPAMLALLAERGVGLVWTPRSNVRLYGNTLPVRTAVALGVELALGTDWMVSGSMNLLRELRCADHLNATYFDHVFSDRDLWQMVTRNPARRAGVEALIGTLEVGKLADVAIFDASARDAHRAVIAAAPEDVVLVMRKGQALYGDAALVAALAGTAPCDALDVCGVAKWVCLANEIGKTFAGLQAGVGSIYPAWFCDTPSNEPTCTPSRTASVEGSTIYTGIPTESDADGDGIPNASDLCPTVFDPVRPMDGGVQADADGDGVGDACDPCPLVAGTSCPP